MRALLSLGVVLCGCAGPYLRWRPAVVFEDSSSGYEWRADTEAAPREVHGESCRNAFGLPLFLWGGWDLAGWGEAGYRDAVAQAQAQAPGAVLTDVRADAHYVNILVFRKECLEVTATAR